MAAMLVQQDRVLLLHFDTGRWLGNVCGASEDRVTQRVVSHTRS
jgi:hypothetical protein